MIASNNEVHDNLIALSNRMNGNNEEIHDELTGLSSLAGNEGEAQLADSIQTISFSTWIKDICDGLKQERELEVNTPEYNQTAMEIRESIENINTLGRQMGMNKEIIPVPANGKESQAAAQAVYNCVALPYEAGANVDYSKYMQAQELNNEMSRSMKRMSYAIAQNAQYGKHAKAFWNAATDAAEKQNKLAGQFLDGIDGIKEYEQWIKEQKAFLSNERTMSDAARSDTMMDGTLADKIDFEGDDEQLRKSMEESIANAESLIKTEKAMLQAGHIDSSRRKLFDSNMSRAVMQVKSKREEITKDNLADMSATAKLEERIKSNPDIIQENDMKKYREMVEKQKDAAPTFSLNDLNKYAKEMKLGLEAMNIGLMAANVTPMRTSLNLMNMLQVGKFIYDVHEYVKDKNAEVETPNMKVKDKADEKEDRTEDPAEALNARQRAKAVKKSAMNIAQNFRTALRNMLQFNEDEPDYDASKDMTDQVEVLVGEVVNTKEFENEDAKLRQQSQSMDRLQNVIYMGTNDKIFDKDVQDMSSEEVSVNAEALSAVMAPMKDENGKYLENFADCYAIGLDEMPDMQKEYTEATTDLMIVGQPQAALAVRESQTDLIAVSREYSALYDDSDLTHVEDTTGKDKELKERADKDEDTKQHMIDVYKPLLVKAGVMMASSAYQKHEFNKNWNESVRERNLKVACQGTMQAMQESAEENKRLAQDFWHGPHGLLR